MPTCHSLNPDLTSWTPNHIRVDLIPGSVSVSAAAWLFVIVKYLLINVYSSRITQTYGGLIEIYILGELHERRFFVLVCDVNVNLSNPGLFMGVG